MRRFERNLSVPTKNLTAKRDKEGMTVQSDFTREIKSPIISYFGSKWRLAEWIISHFPPHVQYVEPFAGSGTVLLRKKPSKQEILNDTNSDLFNLYSILRDKRRAKELRRALEFTMYSRDEFAYLQKMHNVEVTDEIEKARLFVCRTYMSISGLKGGGIDGFRISTTSDAYLVKNHSFAFRSTQKQLLEYHNRLQNVIIENLDYRRIFEKYDTQQTLFYVDPPYPKESRSAGEYKHEFTVQDHRDLAECLKSLKGMWLLSTYECPLYAELFPNVERVTKDAIDMCAQKKTEVLLLSDSVVRRLDESREQIPLFEK